MRSFPLQESLRGDRDERRKESQGEHADSRRRHFAKQCGDENADTHSAETVDDRTSRM